MASSPKALPSPGGPPFVGRETERERLLRALKSASNREGSAWVIEGPGGIGKTRLASLLAEEAQRMGYTVAWGFSQREVLSPFFPFVQIFRSLDSTPNRSGSASGIGPGITVFEAAKPDLFWREVTAVAQASPTLIVTRDRPDGLRTRYPAIPSTTSWIWLRRGGEGEGIISPTDMDVLGEKLSTYLAGEGSPAVAISGLEYLISQNSFLPVLRLIQFLRDSADTGSGKVLVSLNPVTLEKREAALMEGEGTVVAEQERQSSMVFPESEPPATVLMRFLEKLEQQAQVSPLLLILDNIQWADGSSLQALQFLSRNIRDARVVLLALRKTDETGDQDTVRMLEEALDRMEGEGTARRLELGGLPPDFSRSLAEQIVGATLVTSAENDPLLNLLNRMGGNPYFILSTMQMLSDEGWIEKEGKEARITLHPGEEASLIPETLKKAVLRRLTALSDRGRKLLEAAAVSGAEFDVAPVASALAQDVESVSTLLSAVEDRTRIVVRRPESASRWGFQETITREVLLSEMPPPTLRNLSMALASWWERNHLEDVDVLARLYHSAGNTAKGLPLLRKSITHALEAHLSEKVERYLHWLEEMLQIEGVLPKARCRECLDVIAKWYVDTGANPCILEILEMLTAVSPGTGLELEVRGWKALIGGTVAPSTLQAVSDELEQAFSLEPEKITPEADAIRAEFRSYLALHSGDYQSAKVRAEELLQMAERVNSSRLKSVALYRLGWVAYATGQTEEGLAILKRLREVIAAGEPPAEMLKVANLAGVLYALQGNDQAAASSFQEAVELARRHGQMGRVITNTLNLAQAKGDMGRHTEEEAFAREALGLAKRFNVGVPLALTDLGRALVRQDRFQEAIEILSQASEKIDAGGAPDQVAPCRIWMAKAYLGLNQLEMASTYLTEVEKRLDTLIDEKGSYFEIKAILLSKRGDPAHAREALEEGIKEVRARGIKTEEARLVKLLESLK